MKNKSTVDLSLFAFAILLTAFLAAACDDAPPARGTDAKEAAVNQVASTRKPVDCNLISAADIERIVGASPGMSQPIPQSQFSGMTEDYGKESVEGQKEITGLDAFAIFDTSSNMLTVSAGEMDLYVNAARNDVSEAEIVVLTELVLARMR